MKIGIDIDDTICSTYEVMFNYAQYYSIDELKKKQTEQERDNINNKFNAKFHQWTREEEENFFKKYYQKIMEKVKPKMYAKEYIEKWKEEGNEIYIVTARFYTENFNVEEVTKRWLEENKIPYNKLMINARNKAEVVKQEKIEIFVDDNIRNCEEIANIGVKTYMMDSMLNRNYKNERIERVYSWPHLNQKIAK